MTAFKNFLLCTDFSDDANHALSYAVKLASSVKAKIILLHVTEPDVIESPKELENQTTNIDAAFFSHAEIEHEWAMKHGDIEKCIFEAVHEYDIDLVIIGMKGLYGEREILKGSITANLIDEAAPAILGIPGKSTIDCVKRIGIAVDQIGRTDRKSYQTIKDMANACKSKVGLFHVQISNEEVPENELLTKVENFFGELFIGYSVAQDKDVMHATEKYVNENEIDLLVLFHSNSSDLVHHRSLTKQWIFKTSIPLLILPRH